MVSLISKRSVHVLAVTALAFGLAACGKSEDKTAGQQLDSAIAQTEQAVGNAQEKLEASAAQAHEATNNAVEQANDKLAAAAEQANQKLEAGVAQASQVMDDAAISVAVKAEFVKAPEVSALDIRVDTKGGVVTLDGSVPSDSVKIRAEEIARTTSGVTGVISNLSVKAP